MWRANWIKSNVYRRVGKTEWAHALAGGLSARGAEGGAAASDRHGRSGGEMLKGFIG